MLKDSLSDNFTAPFSEMLNCDCMDLERGLKSIPDKFYDIALCDIPYGINVGNMAYLRETKNTVLQKNGKRLNANRNKKVYTLKDWDLIPPPQEYFNELKRISKGQIIFGIEYVNWEGVGPGRIKWNKGIPEGLSFKKYELAYCSMIDNEVELDLLWSGMRQAKSLKEPMTQQGNKALNEKRIHPTQKPLLLYQKLIGDYGFNGCKIIDTHAGAAKSRIAAYLANCYYTGYEIDPEYYHLQEKEFNKFIAQGRLNLFFP